MVSENQFLLHAFCMGIFITAVYDGLRIFRRVIPHNGFWISVEDLGFWIYCAAEVFLMMYHESDGTLRWFAILGAMTGMFLYKKLVSGWLVKYTALFFGKVTAGLLKLFQCFCRPFRTAAGKVQTLAQQRKRRFFVRLEKGKHGLKKRLTFFLKVLKMTL